MTKFFIMKKVTLISLIFLFVFSQNGFAQQEKGIVGSNNWLYNWTEFNPNQEDYDEPTQILTGNITEDTKLSKRETYLLVGNVFVTNNATLTIEPGTVIRGDYDTKASLTITRGASIIAKGLETDPIIFTSSKTQKRPGDWGGIIILGNAPTNRFGNGSVASYYSDLKTVSYSHTNFGGDSEDSNSGIMKFVRIEYAGKRLKNNKHVNGLFLAGVGSNTTINNIMISYAAGNSVEVWGGDLKLNKIVSYRASTNDYKFNYGAQCILQNSLAVRSPFSSNSSGSKCLEVASFEKKEEVDFSKSGTVVTARNLTFYNETDNLKADIEKGLVKEAVYVSENASLHMDKSVITGFNPAVIFESTISINQYNLEKIKFTNMYFNNCKGNIFVENNSNNEDLENWYGNSAFFNVYSKSQDSETFIDIKNNKKPDFRLRINKIIATKEQFAAEDLIIEDN